MTWEDIFLKQKVLRTRVRIEVAEQGGAGDAQPQIIVWLLPPGLATSPYPVWKILDLPLVWTIEGLFTCTIEVYLVYFLYFKILPYQRHTIQLIFKRQEELWLLIKNYDVVKMQQAVAMVCVIMAFHDGVLWKQIPINECSLKYAYLSLKCRGIFAKYHVHWRTQICQNAPSRSWHPSVWEILDPPQRPPP